MLAARFILLLMVLVVGQAWAMTPISGDPIATQAGKLLGTRLPSGVKAYLGIPYAAPPTQQLRWRPPRAFKWAGLWVADRKGPECIQVLRPHNINHYFGEEPSGEDCLYLNVWAPPTAASGAKLPVIVFIYGGGGTIGSSGMALYDGEQVARHGAVFVSMNYRVGALGFMAHPELTQEQGGHSGNYGYLDQSAALKWIHANIAAFGGDPDQVLITGQSFGAGSVAAQIFSPLSKGLFRAAAMWSACNFTTDGPDLATAEKAGVELQRRLGAMDLAEMRDVPADRILAAQAESQVGVHVEGVRTPPLIDGYFTPATKAALLMRHQFADVPILASSNADDLDSNSSALARAKTIADLQAIVRQVYGDNGPEFLRLFPVRADSDVYAAAHAAAQEDGMLEASRSCAQALSKSGTSPAFISLFAHKHSYIPGVKLADQDPASVGAYHTADVPFWLGTLDALNLIRPTRDWSRYDRELSEKMMGSLIGFARTGRLTLGSLSWPAWSSANERYVRLADSIQVETLNGARMNWLVDHPARPLPQAPAERSGPRD